MMGAWEDLAADVDDFVRSSLEPYTPAKSRSRRVVRDGCFGFGQFYQHECDLIDSPLMQRLRRVHQTAAAYLTYPSAHHTRFEHSLGCVILVERMMRSLQNRNVIPENVEEVLQVRLAALLHDVGHCPFSHASEGLLARTRLYRAATEEREEFLRYKPHEVMSYLVVSSPAFAEKWSEITKLHPHEEVGCDLFKIRPQAIADMILGRTSDPQMKYLAQMVHGPVDVDKLDYMQRDALFTGIKMQVDLDRLFYTLERVQLPSSSEQVLAVGLGGAVNLEQLAFNKTVLFESVYHHQKVRAGLAQVERLVSAATKSRSSAWRLKTPSDFLRLDDYDLLGGAQSAPSAIAAQSQKLRRRQLLKRAVVVSLDAIEELQQKTPYSELINGNDHDDARRRRISRFEAELAAASDVSRDDIVFDVPGVPTLEEMSSTQVLCNNYGGKQQLVAFKDLYPTAQWSTSFGQYKHRSYVFAPAAKRRDVALKAVVLLEKHFCIRLNQQALDDAKHEPRLLLSNSE